MPDSLVAFHPKDAYTDITNVKTLKHIQYGFEEYLKEELYEV